jgi:hypothetical protein
LERHELTELHYIAPMANLASIMQQGLLSHHRVARLVHQSVAMVQLQDKRAKVTIPGGLPLHDYVNLYICARNPMMSKRRNQHLEICVLRISTAVLDLTGAIVTDQNAASDYVRFAKSPEGLANVDREMVFAESWKHLDNQILEWRHSSRKCAEVLVPHHVSVQYITGAYVSCPSSQRAFDALQSGLACVVNAHMFFR